MGEVSPLGFSVSGSAAIIFVGVFLAFSTAYTASSNGLEQMNDARSAVDDEALERQNTAISITNATYNDSTGTLTVDVVNEGSTELSVGVVDVLVDNTYRTNISVQEVAGDAETDLWLPGERLHLELSVPSPPNRVKIVSGPGIAVTEVL